MSSMVWDWLFQHNNHYKKSTQETNMKNNKEHSSLISKLNATREQINHAIMGEMLNISVGTKPYQKIVKKWRKYTRPKLKFDEDHDKILSFPMRIYKNRQSPNFLGNLFFLLRFLSFFLLLLLLLHSFNFLTYSELFLWWFIEDEGRGLTQLNYRFNDEI